MSFRWLVCRLLPFALLPLLVPIAPLSPVARAAAVNDLYEATQPVQGSQDAAFAEALKTVLVRVSGHRDAPSRIGALNDPRRYVQRFGVTTDGMLEVGFDSASVDQLLTQAGLPIWGRERPVTLVMLALEDAGGASHFLTLDSPSYEREAIMRAARQRGVPLRWPGMHSEGVGGGTDRTAMLDAAAREGANAVLLGRGSGGSLRWTLVSNDGTTEASGGLEEGIHLAADTFARMYAASGATLDSVVVEISGIADLNAYAGTLNYLEGLTLVRSVALEQVSGDRMRFKLAIRGDAQTLRRAIALDTRLAPAEAGSDPGSTDLQPLAFRYRP